MAFNTFIARLLSHSENQPPAFQQFLLHSEQVWTCPGGVGPCTVTSKAPWAMVTCDPPSGQNDRRTDATENIYLSATSLAGGNKLSAMEHTSKCLFTWHSTFQAKVKQSSAVLFSFSLTFFPVLKTTNYIYCEIKFYTKICRETLFLCLLYDIILIFSD